MPVLVCSISGSSISQGVISKKTGHIYERSTILRYISIYKKCPHSGVDLAESDLIPLQAATATITSGHQSIAGLTDKLANQFDTLVLQTHFLKNALRQSREQLATSLYQQDAAIRVIAKLKSQINESRGELANLIEASHIQHSK